MIFPLEELIKYQKNMYEVTCAASRRAYQLSILKVTDIDESAGKVVSIAARQVLTGEVEFRLNTNDGADIPGIIPNP